MPLPILSYVDTNSTSKVTLGRLSITYGEYMSQPEKKYISMHHAIKNKSEALLNLTVKILKKKCDDTI